MKAIVVTATALAIAASFLSPVATAAGSAASGAQFGSWGVDLAAMDRSVKPGDDFAKFVAGTWLAHAVIPKDRSSVGPGADIQILTEQRLRALVASLEAKPYHSLDGEEKKLHDLYDSYLDRKAIDAAGLAPAQRDLEFIAGLKTLEDVAAAMGRPKIAKVFAATPVAVWRDYLTVHYLDTYAAYLPKAFDEAHFAFHGTILDGRSQQLPRATRAVGLLDGRLAFALGKLYDRGQDRRAGEQSHQGLR